MSRGNRSHGRNVLHLSRPISTGRPQEWHLWESNRGGRKSAIVWANSNHRSDPINIHRVALALAKKVKVVMNGRIARPLDDNGKSKALLAWDVRRVHMAICNRAYNWALIWRPWCLEEWQWWKQATTGMALLTSCGFSVVHPWSRDRIRTDVRNVPSEERTLRKRGYLCA